MADFGKEVRELWRQAEFADRQNREEALADLAFAAPDANAGHWDPQVREYREKMGVEKYGFPLPCLTINTLPQFIGQVIGDRRANATEIKVLPREDGDVIIAEVRSDLMRSIQLQSKADRIYNQAFEQAVTCGVGNFRVDIDYAYDDAFERDLFIRGIANPLAVLWDPFAADPTGRDATHCFVSDTISKDDYKRRFKEDASSFELDAKGTEDADWFQNDTVRIAEYWKIEEKPRTLLMTATGAVEDVTDLPKNKWPKPFIDPATNQPVIRENAKQKFAVMTLTNGRDELSDPLELKIPRLPIIRVMGRETWVGNRRVRFGLVRYARDPARLRDYWRSVIAEKLMLAPRANFIASVSAIEGRESDWTNALVYNDEAQAPVPVTGNDLSAMLNEAQMCSQDLKDTTGLQDASLGMQSNERSGVAINARQHEGDIATIVYHDNMNAAMQEAGEVLNALIPIVYDTARTIRTVGPDEGVQLVRVNDPEFAPGGNIKQVIPDIGLGRYDVTISTGPAYMTRRQEASESMMQFVQAMGPQVGSLIGDLVAKAQDWPDADIIADRLRNIIPPQVLGDEANDNKSPEEIAQQQQAAQQQQQLQQMGVQLEMGQKAAVTRKANAEADKAEADAMRSKIETMNLLQGGNDNAPDATEQARVAIEGYNAVTNRLKAVAGASGPAAPPDLTQHIAPIVEQLVQQELAKRTTFAPVGVANDASNGGIAA
jgi:hypothetical protein